MNYDWETLADSVFRCRLAFCDVTIGLVAGSAGALLIDTGTTLPEAHALAADAEAIADGPVTHVLLTHKHFDHVLGSSVFSEATCYCAPGVAAVIAGDRTQLRDDALRHGADAVEVAAAVAALRVPEQRPPRP